MYQISEKRIIADWYRTLKKAKERGSFTCKFCEIQWTPIFLSKLEKGQYRSTCSLECTKKLQSSIGKRHLKKQWKMYPDKMMAISSEAGRISATTNVKRSRDEIKLFELCQQYYLNVRHNEFLVENWDADIIIDDYKIAILWNGPWHYKEMPHNNHSLMQVKNRDRLKIKKFKQYKWNVFVFEDRFYNPDDAFKVLKQFTCGMDWSGTSTVS